jgi:RecA/RadA recombinase
MSKEDHKRRAEQIIAGLNAYLSHRLVQPAKQLAETIPAVTTTFPLLDKALGIGGIPRGHLTEIVGNPTSGIVTLALKTVTTIQQSGEGAVYLDLAATFNPDYVVRCGLNLETLWMIRPTPQALV